MTRRRGAPVLIELLKDRPTNVERPAVTSSARPAAGVEPKLPGYSRRPSIAGSQNFWFIIAAGVALVLVIGIVAYTVGTNRGETSAVRKIIGGAGPGPNNVPETPISQDPLTSRPGEPQAKQRETVTPPPSPPVTPAAKKLPRMMTPNGDFEIVFDDPDAGSVPGLNYLAVATLYEKDARDACQYLSNKGVPCFLWPETRRDSAGKPVKVDPNSAAAKNGRWVVYVLKGAERPLSADFRPTKDALERLIMDLGARWKQENRLAPTKFDQPHWVKWTN